MVVKENNYFFPIVLGLLLSLIGSLLPLVYSIGLLIGVLGIVLIWKNIRLGIGLLLLTIPFLPDILTIVFIVFISGVFFYNKLFKENNKLEINKIYYPIFIYFLVILISTITSIDPTGSFRDLALHVTGLSFLIVLTNTIDTKEDFNIIATIIVVAGTIVSLYGFYQLIVGVEMDAAWVDMENNPDVRIRIYSVFLNPNIFAEYLIFIIPISIALFWQTRDLKKKVFFSITTVIMLINLVMTLSRGGWLGFAFAIFIYVLLIEKRLLLLGIPMAIGGIYLLPQNIINRILSIFNFADSSNDYRLKLWGTTLEVIKDNKLIGVGFGHLPFKQTFEKYIRTMPTYHAHNTILQTLAEIGIVGFTTFALMLFTIYKYGILILNRSEDKYIKILGAGLISGLAGVFIHGFVENILYIPRIIWTFWITIALILILVKLEVQNTN